MNGDVNSYKVSNSAVVIMACLDKSMDDIHDEWHYVVEIFLNYHDPHEDEYYKYFIANDPIYAINLPTTEDLDICKYVNDLLDKFVEVEDEFIRIRESDGNKVYKSRIMYNLGNREEDCFYEIAERRYESGNIPYDKYELFSIVDSDMNDLFYDPEKFKANYEADKVPFGILYTVCTDPETKEIVKEEFEPEDPMTMCEEN